MGTNQFLCVAGIGAVFWLAVELSRSNDIAEQQVAVDRERLKQARFSWVREALGSAAGATIGGGVLGCIA